MRWPWRRQHPSHERYEEAKQQLAEAQALEPRTRRLAKELDRAITRNHFAMDIQKAMEGR